MIASGDQLLTCQKTQYKPSTFNLPFLIDIEAEPHEGKFFSQGYSGHFSFYVGLRIKPQSFPTTA